MGLLVESLAVIASILVAFGLDAWWGERQLRKDLVENLVSVAEEIDGNANALEVESRFHRTAVSSIDDLILRIDAADGEEWITVPDTVASFAFIFPPIFDASTGAVDALISSGAISRLADRRLTTLLGNLNALIEDVLDGELGARRIAVEEIVPLFWGSPELASAIGRSVEYRRRGLDDSALPSRPIQLQNVEGLKVRLLFRRAWVVSSLNAIERLRADLNMASELVRAEMSDA